MNANETMLLVDDNPDNLIVMKKVLQKALPQVEIVTIQKPEEVMDYVRATEVSVVVSDVQMPVLNGIELCGLLKAVEETRHIPVLLVTSHDASSGLKAKGLNAGADDFLTRPIDNEELVARVKVALRIHRAEAQLRDTASQVQQDYQLLFEKMLSGFAVHEMLFDSKGNPVDYRFLSVNPAFETIMNLRAEEIIGKTVREVLPGMEPQRIERYGRVVATGEPVYFEDYFAPLDRHFDVTAFCTGENQFAVSFTDITERKRAEEALRESEEFLNRTGEIARVGGWKMDLDQNKAIWSQTTANIHELPEVSELDLDKAFDFFHPDDKRSVRECVDAAIKSGKSFEFESRLITAKGNVCWVRSVGRPEIVSGNCRHFSGIMQDLTERKQAEAENDRLLEAIYQTGETVVITDVEGTIEYVNPAFEKVTGYTREEAIGQNPRVLKSGKQDAAFYQELWDKLLRGETWSGQFINKKKDGTHYTEEATISPIKDATGTIVNYVAVKRDITDQLIMQGQLQQAQKMESVGRLAGGVAHDFNNLLMGVMGYAELCRDEIAPDHPVREWLDQIISGSERSAQLTHQLLAFARKQVIAPIVLDLNDAISGMLKLLRRLIGEDITINWKPGAEIWHVNMDPVQVDQILANLTVNARDAIGGAGSVTIETGKATFDQSYCADHAGSVPGDYTQLTVTDSGCGMDEETLKNLFEPFFTTKSEGEGTGLGLATVYGIVKQNNGFINVCGEPGQGATFDIYLPRVAATEDVDLDDQSPPEPLGGNETILVVEDEKSIRITVQLFLEDLGYSVLVAEDPEQALSLSAEHDGEIDLLVTDVIMPGMSGRYLADRLLESRPATKLLYISGFTADIIAQRGILDDGMNFLSKPFGRDVLAHKVREVLDA